MTARRTPPRANDIASLDEKAIDALYGLEPVIEPAADGPASGSGAEATQFTTVQCPYCGEPFETLIDSSAGSASYIEDCHICCRPIELGVDVDLDGALAAVTARRTD
jgi:cysteine-rich CPXCG protein